MILHFLTDDKFADYAINQFGEPEMHSEFVLVADALPLQNVKQLDALRVISSTSTEFAAILDSLSRYSAIILHGLFWPWQETVIRRAPKNVKVAWVYWGGDVFGRLDLKNTFLAPWTKKLHRWKQIRRWLKGRGHITTPYELPAECFRRIDYCLEDVDEDMKYAMRYLRSDVQCMWYNYYSVEETIGVLKDAVCSGSNILVGNSCTLENNHLDAFAVLQQMDTADSEVIVPLSYGEPWLRKKVISSGHASFERFRPLIEFMPRDEYNQIIQSCSVVVMNHWRGQAFGNVMTSLWLGARVYMSRKSPLYAFFRRIGCVLYCIEDDLKPANPQALLPLSAEDREVNRNIIRSIYSKDVMRQRNAEIVRELDGE